MVLGLLCVAPGVHPEDAWDERIDAACCPYPEHDPRDYNWPYSHLQYSEVVPDVVGSFVPMTELNVSFPTGAIADYGKPVAPAQLAQQPAVAFALEPDRDASTLHTLAMVDPDVPSRDAPVDGEWLHWLVYDIPCNDTRRGKTLAAYAPPKPAQCAASERLCLREHRVTLVLWEQPGPLALHDEDSAIPAATSEGRARFKARDFASRRARTARPARQPAPTARTARPARPPAPTARTARTPGRRPAVALP